MDTGAADRNPAVCGCVFMVQAAKQKSRPGFVLRRGITEQPNISRDRTSRRAVPFQTCAACAIKNFLVQMVTLRETKN